MTLTKTIWITAIITLAAFAAITYSSCTKNACAGITCYNYGTCSGGTCKCPTGYTGTHCETAVDPCASITCLNGGACSGGVCTCPTGYSGPNCAALDTTSIIYTNDTYTPISFIANGATTIIPVGGSVTFRGAYTTVLTATATTSGTTSSSTQIGDLISWSLSDAFPASGTTTHYLDVSPNYFFLKVTNNSAAYSINQLYVNYLLTSQTVDNITIPNDGNTYNTGYYLAFSNTQIYATSSSGTHWTWMPVIPNIFNAQVTIIAN